MNDYCNTIINAAFRAKSLSRDEIQVIVQGYNENTKAELYRISESKKILPFIGVLLCSLNLDYLYWDEVVTQYRKRNEYMLYILTQLFMSFKGAGVRKIFVYENFGALLMSGSKLELFASGDIDLYADLTEREKIEKALASNGFFIKRASDSRETVASEYYNDNLREKFYISIMWQPLSRKKMPFDMDINYCIDWDNLCKYKDTDITLPSPEALMYLCILHVSVHGYSRAPDVRLYADVYNVSKLNINWEKVISFAQHDEYLIRVITVCIISNELFGVGVPNSVIQRRNEYKREINKLLSIVFDKENNTLKYNPSKIDILKIEAYSDYKYLIKGILSMLLPKAQWVKKYYLNGKGNIIIGYMRHFKNLV